MPVIYRTKGTVRNWSPVHMLLAIELAVQISSACRQEPQPLRKVNRCQYSHGIEYSDCKPAPASVMHRLADTCKAWLMQACSQVLPC